jgi:AcrR family transcriptional regulator
MVPTDREPYDADALVDVAVQVFLDRGYDRASMVDVAQAAGLVKSSLYHHVASKEELLERALRRALDALFATFEAPDYLRGRAIDRLRAVIRHTVEIMCEQPAEVALLLRVRGNTEIERWAVDQRRELDRVVTKLVREAVADGDLRSDLDTALVTRLIFGMSNSVVEWYRPTGRTRPGAIVDTIVAIVFDGLRRTPPNSGDAS